MKLWGRVLRPSRSRFVKTPKLTSIYGRAPRARQIAGSPPSHAMHNLLGRDPPVMMLDAPHSASSICASVRQGQLNKTWTRLLIFEPPTKSNQNIGARKLPRHRAFGSCQGFVFESGVINESNSGAVTLWLPTSASRNFTFLSVSSAVEHLSSEQ